MRIHREELINALELCRPGLSPSRVYEQSDCFIFKGGTIHTMNERLFCSYKKPGFIDGVEGAVTGASFLEILKTGYVEEFVEIYPKNGKFIVVGKGRKSSLNYQSDITLPMEKVDKPQEWSKLSTDFSEAVTLACDCAGTDPSQAAYLNVHIHPDKIESTDRLQLVQYKLHMPIKEPMFVEADSLRNVPPLGMTDVSATENYLHLRNKVGLTYSCRRMILEDFPEFDKYFKVRGVPVEFPKAVAKAVRAAETFSKEFRDRNKILLTLKSGEILVTGEGVTGKHGERKRVKYTGDMREFYMPPSIITKVVEQFSKCRISDDLLIVIGSGFRYASCLMAPEEKV